MSYGKFPEKHDDMLGTIMTGLAGGNQWNVKNINNTLYPLQFLRNNSNDFFCTHIQSPHWRKQGANLDSIHIHYLLDSTYTAGQTLVFDVYWAWIMPQITFPALAQWNSQTGISIVLDASNNLPAWYTSIVALVSDFSSPTNDNYGAGLAIRVVRGNGTYTGELGIWWLDVHALKDRDGSRNEASD